MALLLSNARRLASCGAHMRVLAQPFSAQPEPEQPASEEITVKVNDYKAHHLDPPSTEVTTSKAELMDFFKTMYRMRRHAQPCFRKDFPSVATCCVRRDNKRVYQCTCSYSLLPKGSVLHVHSLRHVVAPVLPRYFYRSKATAVGRTVQCLPNSGALKV